MKSMKKTLNVSKVIGSLKKKASGTFIRLALLDSMTPAPTGNFF